MSDLYTRTQPPLPEAPGDVKAMRETIAKIVDPDAWHETLPTDGCGEYWMARRNKARSQADAILALPLTPQGTRGMKISQSAREAAAEFCEQPDSGLPAWLAECIRKGDGDSLAIVQAIAAAEARGEERMREKAAKRADIARDTKGLVGPFEIIDNMRAYADMLGYDIRNLPVGEE